MKYEDFINSTEFTYKLYLQDCIADASRKVPELTLVQLAESDLEYENAQYKVAVNDIQFSRKVYQPGEIKAEIMITLKGDGNQKVAILTPDYLKALLLHRRVKLSILPKNAKAETVVAKNYYIHEISPRVVRDSAATQMFVTLSIYSMDKLMTINKYSKAYVVKKLGSEILCAESKLFGYNKTALVPVAIDNMQHLRYQQSEVIDGKTVNIPSEFIQPYLVQYNETFYDFMARTANRCGEFLLFEDGKLILGLPKGDDEVATLKNYSSITYQDFVTAPLTVDAYTRDSVGKEENDLNSSNTDATNNGYPEGTFGTNLNYNSELSHEDYIFPLFKDKFSSFASALEMSDEKEAIQKVLLDVFSEVVGNTEDGFASVPSIIKNLAVNYSKSLMDARTRCNKTNAEGNETWIDAYKDNVEQSDGKKTVPFATLSEKGWLSLNYYSQTRRLEEQQQQNMVCVDMGTNCMPVKLGEIVAIDRLPGFYVITEIRQTNSLKKSGVQNVVDQTQLIYAMPVVLDNGNISSIVPPVIAEAVIRKSGPQTAFVVDNEDPKSQGRVRIAFPWQAVGTEAMKQESDQAKEQQAEKEQAVKDTDEKLIQLKEERDIKQKCGNELDDLNSQLQKESDKTKQSALVNDKKNSAQQEKSRNDARLSRINADLDESNPDSVAGQVSQLNKQLAATKDATAKAQLESQLKTLTAKQESLEAEEKTLKTRNEVLKGIESELDSLDDSVSPVEAMKQNKAAREEKMEQVNKEIVDTDQALGKAKLEKKNADAAVDKIAKKWEDQLKNVASPWVRVAMPMATGDGAGMLFNPCNGDEVLVNFDNDNVERPYVAGSLYSKEHTAPGDSMIIKSPSGQKLVFDTADKGWDFVKEMSPLFDTVCGYLPVKVGGMTGNARKLAGEITMSDEFGMFEVAMSSHKRAVSINSPFGKVDVNAFTGISISAPNGDVKIEGKNVTIAAGNNLKLVSGTNVDHDEFSWGDFFKGGLSDAVDAFAPGLIGAQLVDVKLIRCVTDVFLRPIEGTLCLKSNNYLMLEAGNGKANVNVERYSAAWQKQKNMESDADKQLFFAKTVAYLNRINQKVTLFCTDYEKLKKDALQKKASYEANLAYIWKDGVNKPEFMKAAFKLGDGEFKKNNDSFNGGTVDLSVIKQENVKEFSLLKPLPLPKKNSARSFNEIKQFIKPSAEAYAEAVYQLQKKTREFKMCFSDDTMKAVNLSTVGSKSDAGTAWIDEIFKEVVFKDDNSLQQKSIHLWEDRFGGATEDPKDPFLGDGFATDKDDTFGNAQYLSRKIIAHLLLKLYTHEKNVMVPATPATAAVYGKFFTLGYKTEAEITDDLLTKKWDDVASLGSGKKDGKIVTILKGLAELVDLKSFWKPVVDPEAPKLGWDRQVWNDESGRIIFSDAKNATYGFKGEKIEKWSQAGLSNVETLKKALTDI